MTDGRCDLLCLDLSRAEEARRGLDVDAAATAAGQAKALGDPTRLTIAMVLGGGQELCVCDLGWITGRPENGVGHHSRFTWRPLGREYEHGDRAAGYSG